MTAAMTGRGWRQARLAEEAGVSPATVSNVLTSKVVPSQTVLDQLLHALKITGQRWQELHALRQRANSRTQRLDHYLAATESAVRDYPFAGVLSGAVPPLTTVYVRQLARREALGAGSAACMQPADELLTQAGTCVVVAGPGGGKSSLLRTYLADTVADWRAGKAGPALAVLVPASALLGLPLADALAQYCNADLAGLVESLPAELFARRPYPDTCWLVLVDGLDEVTDPQARQRILRALAAVANGPLGGQYRFVVATRPLPQSELGLLGTTALHYQLEPFNPHDLRDVARTWFRALGLPEPDVTADRFLSAVGNANLAGLARVPLMATMLCQLQAAAPHRALPTTRSAVYDRFTDLLHQRQYAPSAQKVLHTVLDGYGPDTTARADEVLDHLPELIGHLAASRLTGDTRPTLDILRDHPLARRPARILEGQWNDFLTSALCRSGLITRAGSNLAFLHQTLLEHQAARHTTRDEQARTQALEELLITPAVTPTGITPIDTPSLLKPESSSYTGFLLDRLLAAQDHTTEQTAKAIAGPASPKWVVCQFLATQVHLRTGLPADTADHLTSLVNDPDLDDDWKTVAAQALAEVEGYREKGATLLASLADDSHLSSHTRVHAAVYLAEVEGYQAAGATLLASLADSSHLDSDVRVSAAQSLAEVEGYREEGATILAIFADRSDIDSDVRVTAAMLLAKVEGYREEAATLLASLADHPDLHEEDRVDAAAYLAEVEGYREEGASLLASVADNPNIGNASRAYAARTLASLEVHQ
nr:helix-turn-helix domain-containing protein [Streptomyces halstedii]